MAVYNEINVGRFNRFLQKYLQLKGSPPAPSLAGDIGFTFDLAVDTPENWVLQGWDTFGANIDQGPTVAQQTRLQIRNPANSNVVALVHRIVANMPSAAPNEAILQVGAAAADLATVITQGTIDQRSKPQSACSVSGQAAAGGSLTAPGFATVFQPILGIAGAFEFITDDPWPLLPGRGIQITSTVVNLRIWAGFFWRERFLEESERT